MSKIDQTGIHSLLANAKKANPTHVIISSRSSEWGSAATSAFKNFLGHAPLVVRLSDFDEAEQRLIFNHHAPGEDFAGFLAEVTRFDLEVLLPNPQFLKLFADAYIESDRRFYDKRSIFAKAVDRLAREVNESVARINSALSSARKVEISAEVFAKLLLSGAEGVCMDEANENRTYPLLASLFSNNATADGILATRLFKPADTPGRHRPVHKIVAEYCAANYLTKRVADPADHLTLPACLSVIAPNSTVRNELRGLLGWMASLGNTAVQESAIALDPYAVLANGDPSQLTQSSKRLLINRLKEIEAKDPLFRRGDFWRRFSVSGFFTEAVMGEIKPILETGEDGNLCDLILELLSGSPGTEQLVEHLRKLALAPDRNWTTRTLANKCLLLLKTYDNSADLEILILEGTQTSLEIAAQIIETLGAEAFETSDLAIFFRACARLYPGHRDYLKQPIGAHYSLKRLINKLGLITVERLLENLSTGLACNCGKKNYDCDCRNGISKIVGSMLDRYFDLAAPPFDHMRIWRWTANLNFHDQRSPTQSKSVYVLQNNNDLRQRIIAHEFRQLTDRGQIFDTKMNKFDSHSHSGLNFQESDYLFLVDLAFETNNSDLWVAFIARHQFHRREEDRGPDRMRRHMREQALRKPDFMRVWAKHNRDATEFNRKNMRVSLKHHQQMKRHRKKETKIRNANIEYVQANRELVEAGRHWPCLIHFAQLVLESPNKIEQEFGDERLVRNALRNCLDFLAPRVPDLPKLAALQCASEGLHSETVLFAACLEIMRDKGNLEIVDPQLLKALRTNIHMGYSGVSREIRDSLTAEVDRLAFHDYASAENFLRQYIEPQLETPGCNHPEVWFLNDGDALGQACSALSVEWLDRYDELGQIPLSQLFEIAAQHGNRDELKTIIAKRCAECLSKWPTLTNDQSIEQKRTFWFLRAWYFLDESADIYWNWLKSDKDSIHLLYERSGRIGHNDHPHWPKLTSAKVESILDGFIDKWPNVELPGHWGTGSPPQETAYRFLTEVIWAIDSDGPENAIPVLNRLLLDVRMTDLHQSLKSILANQLRKMSLRDFEPPAPEEIVNQLDRDAVVTVEGLRQLVVQELQDFQRAIAGGEYNPANSFYEKDERLDEEPCTEIIAERLSLKLQPQNITVTPEHQLKAEKRSDFTVAKVLNGKRRLLVTEVKGQWHKELYTAASSQLHERYSIHPDAEQQGIFLIIWFGSWEKVGGRTKHGVESAQELKRLVEAGIPPDIKGLIDVFVLDVSKLARA